MCMSEITLPTTPFGTNARETNPGWVGKRRLLLICFMLINRKELVENLEIEGNIGGSDHEMTYSTSWS